MNPRRLLATALVAFTCVGDLNGATVMFCLDAHLPEPGKFVVTAMVSGGDNAGLAGFGFDIFGPTSITNVAPRTLEAQKEDAFGPAGFTLRSPNNNPAVYGQQDTVLRNPNLEGAGEGIPVYHMGQTASSFAAQGITPLLSVTSPTWGVPLLLVTGTYTGFPPSFGPGGGFATVFNSTADGAQRPAEMVHLAIPSLAQRDFCLPEPSTIGLTVGMLLGARVVRRVRCESFGEIR